MNRGDGSYRYMSAGGVFQLITSDGKQDRMIMATTLLNQRIGEIERGREREWDELHAQFIGMLYERRSMLPMYHYWVLRRGHGDFSRLPLDVRRMIIRRAHRWHDRAVPLEEIVVKCRLVGNKKLAEHVQAFMGGRYEDAIYRPGRDYREWAL